MIALDSATPEDAEAVLAMMEVFYAEERYPFDRVVLTLGWSLEYHGRDAFVDELFIAPSCRGRGLSKLALGVLEDACRDL